MGLYSIECPQCKKHHIWFSGNIGADQRCPECKNPNQDKKEENKMDYEQANLDSLNKIISVQNELITFLKAEVERLKASQVTINPVPGVPAPPAYPWVQPWAPSNPPYQYPYYGPWITTTSDTTKITIGDSSVDGGTVGSGSSTVFTGPSLPPGSIQSIGCSSHEMVKWGTPQNGGEKCKKCGFGSGWATSDTNLTAVITNLSPSLDNVSHTLVGKIAK